MDKEITLQRLLDMKLHEYMNLTPYDLMIRVPGGWIYTVQKTPVFVAEPFDDAEFDEVEKIVDAEVKSGVQQRNADIQKDEDIRSESILSDDGDDACGTEKLPTDTV